MLILYKWLIYVAEPLLKALLGRRVNKGKEDAARLPERMGISIKDRPNRTLLWVHAASVGEAQSALILIDRLLKNKDIKVLVTTGTVTSAQLMAQNLPHRAFHQFYPLDHPRWVERFLEHWQPDGVFWMESELWPNMLREIKRRNIPAALVNARLSERSFANWALIKGAAQTLLSTFSVILTQTEKDERRFKTLGAKTVITTDNLKFSAAPLPADAKELKSLSKAVQDRPVWLYASTHKGEEELACRIHTALAAQLPGLLTIIVPRHPERRHDIKAACAAAGLQITLRGADKPLPVKDTDIYIADTLGELGLFYRLAPLAVIGRSFSDDGGGGHNPIEAAQLDCAVLHGPHVQYQQDIYDEMNAAGAALRMESEAQLQDTLLTLLSDPERLRIQQEQGEVFAACKVAVIDRVMSALTPLLMRAGLKP